jgi:hypothetical protein
MKKTTLVILIALLSSCASVQIATIDRTDKKIELYVTKLPTREYIELGYIEVTGSIFHSRERLLKKMIKRADKVGANAIISLRYSYQFWYPCLEGVLVKYR